MELPDDVLKRINECQPPDENYTGMVINKTGNYTFINGRPSLPFGIWGSLVYAVPADGDDNIAEVVADLKAN